VPNRLKALTQRLARQWGIACTFKHFGEFPVEVPGLANEIQQMLREGVANAVRHGSADQISITLWAEASELKLKIVDNGIGLPPNQAGSVRPRSLHERTQALRGSFKAHGGSAGTTIEIRLPRNVPR
jgi:signal transduction histidine kinase